MHIMEDIEKMPLPFEGNWGLPTRFAAVLAFLRALLRWVYADELGVAAAITSRHAEHAPPPPGGYWFPPESLTPVETMDRLLSTRWHRAEEEMLRARPQVSPAEEMATAADCVPRNVEGDNSVDLAKVDAYARERAVALGANNEPKSLGDLGHEPQRSWRGPKLVLVHDQLERIAHWATEGDAAATLALLRRLRPLGSAGGTILLWRLAADEIDEATHGEAAELFPAAALSPGVRQRQQALLEQVLSDTLGAAASAQLQIELGQMLLE